MSEVRVDTSEIKQAAQALRLLAAGKLLEDAKPTAFRLLVEAQNDMRGLVSGPTLKVRTGALRGSIQTEGPTIEGAALRGRVGLLKDGPAQRYGHFLVRGGTITARKKYLAIPIGPALTGAGVSRYQSPRDISDLVFIPSKKPGTALLARISGRGKSRRITPYFVLKHSVTIGPHDYVAEPRARLQQKGASAFTAYLANALTIT